MKKEMKKIKKIEFIIHQFKYDTLIWTSWFPYYSDLLTDLLTTQTLNNSSGTGRLQLKNSKFKI